MPSPPTDQELDTFIRTRFALLGIDISVLPEADPSAPIDQARVLNNARSILRSEATAAAFSIDEQFVIPTMYPAPLEAWTGALDR
jgi:hypothetical protein